MHSFIKNKKLISLWIIFWLGILVPYSAHAVVFSAIIAFYKILLGETHALAVSIKQNAVSANQIIKMVNQSNKNLAESINVIKQSERLSKTLINYSAKTGQPLSTQCLSLADNKAILIKYELSENNNLLDMQNYSSKISADINNNKNNYLQNHHSQYCSFEEQKAGICKEIDSKKQGQDINFAQIFSQDNLDKEQVKAANIYMEKVIQPKIDKNSQCKTLDCQSSASAELHYNAALSIAGYSLNGQLNQRKINTD